ncbi:MAG: thiolase family protein [Deltaproteobacteria bacterium]|nr:thiolase family protein [Deltaproteobacteria bacterium]MBM4324076.1 thiolase family protein [Deltaproteobacteria bacterium]
MTKLREVVVVDAVRSPIGKSGWKGMEKGGQLCQASAQDLMANTIRGLLERVRSRSSKFNEVEIENVIIGCLSQIGEQGLNIARIASLLAGIPKEASGCTVNQYCNSGLKAINIAAHEIMVGEGDIMICGGVEIMSHYGMISDLQVAMKANYPVRLSPRLSQTGMSVPQGVCAEMISADQKHTREDLERFGMWSMQKAVEAERKGWYADHIVPFEFNWENVTRRVEKDEVLRVKATEDPEGYLQGLLALPTPFKENGLVSPGSSSQIVDGAAAVMLMSGSKAEALGLEPLCRIKASAVAGGAPVPMLLAPIPAVKKALQRAGKAIDEMDIIEPNEAFASPLLQFADELGYGRFDSRVNPTGGAIALGHPIGASGALYFGEMVHHLKRTGGKAGIQMLCGGGGVGIATVVEAV